MFLKTSISTTKKLFKKTLDNVKYLFSSTGYHKIPKSPPCCAAGQSYTELDKKKQKIITKEAEQVRKKGTNYAAINGRHVPQECYRLKPELEHQGSRREGRSYLVAQKLAELKMLENYEDLEQVLFYYSRLTCPAYVEIVDKFFMEMYSELFNASS